MNMKKLIASSLAGVMAIAAMATVASADAAEEAATTEATTTEAAKAEPITISALGATTDAYSTSFSFDIPDGVTKEGVEYTITAKDKDDKDVTLTKPTLTGTDVKPAEGFGDDVTTEITGKESKIVFSEGATKATLAVAADNLKDAAKVTLKLGTKEFTSDVAKKTTATTLQSSITLFADEYENAAKYGATLTFKFDALAAETEFKATTAAGRNTSYTVKAAKDATEATIALPAAAFANDAKEIKITDPSTIDASITYTVADLVIPTAAEAADTDPAGDTDPDAEGDAPAQTGVAPLLALIPVALVGVAVVAKKRA